MFSIAVLRSRLTKPAMAALVLLALVALTVPAVSWLNARSLSVAVARGDPAAVGAAIYAIRWWRGLGYRRDALIDALRVGSPEVTLSVLAASYEASDVEVLPFLAMVEDAAGVDYRQAAEDYGIPIGQGDAAPWVACLDAYLGRVVGPRSAEAATAGTSAWAARVRPCFDSGDPLLREVAVAALLGAREGAGLDWVSERLAVADPMETARWVRLLRFHQDVVRTQAGPRDLFTMRWCNQVKGLAERGGR